MNRDQARFGVALAVVAVLAAWPVLSVPYLPTNDGPQHILSGVMQNHFDDPGSVYPARLIPQLQYAERGFSLFFLPLEAMLGWRRATQVFLVMLVELTGLGVLFVTTGVDPRRRAAGLLGFPLAYTWPLYMGFFPFAITSAFGLFVIGLELRRRRHGDALIFLLLAAMSFMHVVAAALTGLALAIVRLLSDRPRREKWMLAAFAVVPLAVFVAAAIGHSDVANKELTTRFVPFAERFFTLPRLIAPGPMVRAVVVSLVIVAASVHALRRQRDELALAIVALSFLVVGALAPLNMRGWQFFAPRWFVLPVLLTPALLPLELLSVGALAAVASLLVTVHLNRRLHDGCASVFGVFPPDARIELPITVRDECGPGDVPYLGAWSHAGALFAAEHRSYQPFLFLGSSSTYAFAGKPVWPPAPPLDLVWSTRSEQFRNEAATHDRVMRMLAVYGRPYDRVGILGGERADFESLIAAGYVQDLSTEHALWAHFEGCSVTVVLPPGRVEFELGIGPVPLSGGTIEAHQPRERRVDHALCGPGYVKIGSCRRDVEIAENARLSCQ